MYVKEALDNANMIIMAPNRVILMPPGPEPPYWRSRSIVLFHSLYMPYMSLIYQLKDVNEFDEADHRLKKLCIIVFNFI